MDTGACSDGLATMVQPAASAGAILNVNNSRGQFPGKHRRRCPRARARCSRRSPAAPCPPPGRRSCRLARRSSRTRPAIPAPGRASRARACRCRASCRGPDPPLFVNRFAKSSQHPAPLAARNPAPVPVVEGASSRRHRVLNVLIARFGDQRPRLASERVNRCEARLPRAPLPPDPHGKRIHRCRFLSVRPIQPKLVVQRSIEAVQLPGRIGSPIFTASGQHRDVGAHQDELTTELDAASGPLLVEGVHTHRFAQAHHGRNGVVDLSDHVRVVGPAQVPERQPSRRDR